MTPFQQAIAQRTVKINEALAKIDGFNIQIDGLQSLIASLPVDFFISINEAIEIAVDSLEISQAYVDSKYDAWIVQRNAFLAEYNNFCDGGWPWSVNKDTGAVAGVNCGQWSGWKNQHLKALADDCAAWVLDRNAKAATVEALNAEKLAMNEGMAQAEAAYLSDIAEIEAKIASEEAKIFNWESQISELEAAELLALTTGQDMATVLAEVEETFPPDEPVISTGLLIAVLVGVGVGGYMLFR